MRMAALSRASGVPVPTIKFYLREGLLPPGMRTSPNQSQYDGAHVRRLALIRGLTELAGCSLATVAEVVHATDNRTVTPAQVSAILSRRITDRLSDRPVDGVQPRFQLVDAVMRERGWRLTGNDEHRLTAATLLGIMQTLDVPHTSTSLRAYAAAATLTADAQPGRDGDHDTERAVLATVLDDALMSSLRRMAQVSTTGAAPPAPGTSRPEAPPADGVSPR